MFGLTVSRTTFLGLMAAFSALLGGCAAGSSAVGGNAAYDIIPAASTDARPLDYRIGPLDVLKITVFQEPDLSLDGVPVDASGNLLYPLIGNVAASGKTSSELSFDIAQRLEERFLVNPQVSIIVKESATQNVTVEGQVTKPGVFPITGSTTLLQAMAYAEGPTRIAALDDVTVFRRKGEDMFAARFDLQAIRRNMAPNPQILGGDIVVVGFSPTKSAYRDALQLMPALAGVFVQIAQNN